MSIYDFNGEMKITNSLFIDFTALHDQDTDKQYEGSFIYSIADTYHLTIKYSTVDCLTEYLKGVVEQ